MPAMLQALQASAHCVKVAKPYSTVDSSRSYDQVYTCVFDSRQSRYVLPQSILSSNAHAVHDVKGAQYLVAEGCCRT